MKSPPIYVERFSEGRTKVERRYALREVMSVEALRLSEDIAALKSAIAALKTILPYNIKKGWSLLSVEERREAEFDLWNEIRLLQRWLRKMEEQMRKRFLK